MKGKVRVPARNAKCPKCGELFEDIGRKGYICGNCMTVPERYYLDVHYAGRRVRIFCDKQGKALDTFERAFSILAHINYEIDNHLFDPRRYIRAELEEFYFERRIKEWLEGKMDDMRKGTFAPGSYKKYKTLVKNFYIPFFQHEDVRDIRSGRIEQFYRQLPVSSTKYLKDIITGLETFFYAMEKLEYIEKKPVFPNVKVEEKIGSWVTREFQDGVLSHIPVENTDIIFSLLDRG